MLTTEELKFVVKSRTGPKTYDSTQNQLLQGCVPVNFANFSRTVIQYNTYERLARYKVYCDFRSLQNKLNGGNVE